MLHAMPSLGVAPNVAELLRASGFLTPVSDAAVKSWGAAQGDLCFRSFKSVFSMCRLSCSARCKLGCLSSLGDVLGAP